MTDYNSMSHQQLYDYVFSGSPSNVESEATLNQSHGKSVTEATSDLTNTLTNIQASWSGAAADEFTQQTNLIMQQMRQHAEAADTMYTWMNYASQYLTWAQSNMPSPPSSAEQDLAAVNKNSVSEWGIGILTGGTSYLASNAAQEDIAKKKAAAVSVMTQLASAYGTANNSLSGLDIGGGTDIGGGDPPPPSSTKSSQGSDGNQNGSNGSNASAAGMIMPMTMAMQGAAGGYSGRDSGVTSHVSTGSYTSGSGSSSGSTSSGTGTSGSGVTDPKLPTTVTSGLGDLPTTGTTTGSSGGTSGYTGLGTTAGSGASSSGLGGLGAGGLSEFGGSGAAGLGSGGLGSESEGSLGSTGLGSGNGKSSAALSGGTGTGELGEEAGGTGYGSQAGAGSSTAAAATGEAEGTGSTGQSGMMGGGMGGMGRGGGGEEERGNRASWLKEDPDYWYGDKMKNAAPPGGVIE